LLIQQGSFDPKEKAWKISVEDTKTNEERIIVANYVSIASGHHGTPELAKFKGQETFSG
jgi:cation diffusion facilitator CzcD-associated flavoprotein CzcO